MKTSRLYTAILSLMMPTLVFSLGLGEIKVESFLNQPFKAEIALLDAEGIPLNGIKVSLASLEEFERVGIPLDDVLSLFKFEIRRNSSGHPVIEISSLDRVTEPYLQILVDLVWANGQLYRSYTVLLDPPGYKLVIPASRSVYHSGAQTGYGSGVAHKDIYEQEIKQPAIARYGRKEASYGSTLAGESIWQIAQRYSTPDTSLQQIILAIVGTNSQAFTQGNLNGLKVGERLRIPSNEEVLRVPADLAKQEVEAHDEAWKTRQEIKHVLLPPYINGETGVSQFGKTPDLGNNDPNSELVQTPLVWNPELQKPVVSPEIQASTATKTLTSNIPPVRDNRAENTLLSYILPIPNVGAVVKETTRPFTGQNSVSTENKSENSAMKQQVSDLELKNSALKKQVEHQNEEFKALRLQIQSFVKGNGNQPLSPAEPLSSTGSNLWVYLLLLLGATGGGYWFWSKRHGKDRLGKPDSQDQSLQLSLPERDVDAPLNEGKSASVTVSTSEEEAIVTRAAPVVDPSASPSPEVSINKPAPDTSTLNTNGHASVTLLEVPVAVAEEVPATLPEADANDSTPVATAEEPAAIAEEVPVIVPEPDMSDSTPVVPVQEETVVSILADDEAGDDDKGSKESKYLLDFEPGLDKFIVSADLPEGIVVPQADANDPIEYDTEETEEKKNKDKQTIDESLADFNELPENQASEEIPTIEVPDQFDFGQPKTDSSDAIPQTTPITRVNNKAPKLAKSKAALETLLELAKTYISMEDYETARQSLEEVLNFGSDHQKMEAQSIMDDIRDK